MRLESRPATARDIEAFFGQSSPRSVRAFVAEHDGEVMGIVGYYIDGGIAVVFSDVKDMPKAAIWRLGRAFMDGLRLPAACEGTDKSRAFLERLGWEYESETPDGHTFMWWPRDMKGASDV